MPVKNQVVYLSKDEDAQLSIESNFLEETVVLTISSPVQDWRPVYLELPAQDLSELIKHLASVYAELVMPEGPIPETV